MEYKCLSDFLFKGENKNINISVSKNSPVNASLSLDGYKHSMVQIIALTIALKMKTVIVNPPIVSDTYVFIAIINELGGTAKIYNKRYMVNNWSSSKRYASPKAGMELYLDLVFRQ